MSISPVPGRGRQGFTLAELLIAIVIFAVVISLTYGAYNATFTVVSNADAESKYGERARVTLERFAEDFGGFYLGSAGMLVGESESFGEFRGDNLRFTSRAHLIFNKDETPKGYAVISYTIEQDEDSGLLRLYRADIPVLPGVTPDEEEQGFLLCDGLREVTFTYTDKDGNETESWSTLEKTRNGKAELPVLVKLKIGFADEEAEDSVLYFSTAAAIFKTGS